MSNSPDPIIVNSPGVIEPPKKASGWIIAAILVGALLIALGLVIYQNYQLTHDLNTTGNPSSSSGGATPNQQLTNIHGTVTLTAMIPEDPTAAEIRIFQRRHNNGDFQDTGLRLPLAQTGTFDWSQAIYGENYDLMASVYANNELIKSSPTVTVTAPAADAPLNLAIYWTDLPNQVLQEIDLTIKGNVTVNGYIPDGAVLSIRENDTQVARVASVTHSNDWSWDEAKPLQIYNLDAVLLDRSGQQIGLAETRLQAQQSDANIALVINSSAQPPVTNPTPSPAPTPSEPSQPTPPAPPAVQKVKISGYITLNGPLDNNSSVLILWRHPGQTDWQVAKRLTNPENVNQYWEWDQAEAGQQYEFNLALQVNENNTSTLPQTKTVTAPATNLNFTLNTNFNVGKPNDQARLDSCANFQGNSWEAKLIIPYQDKKIGNYWVQVGEDPHNPTNKYNDIVTVIGTNGDVHLSVRVVGNTVNYLRYSQSYCVRCSDPANFSSWTDNFQFQCFN